MFCSSNSTFSTSGTVGRCCLINGNCDYATACNDGSISFAFGGNNTCDPVSFPRCFSMTVYESFPSASKSWISIDCGNNAWSVFTVYRTISTTTAATGTGSLASETTPPIPGSGTNSNGPVKTGPPSGASANETPNPTPSSSSQAWIAAAVIVPIIGAIAAGIIGFFLGKRRQRQQQTTAVPVTPGLSSVYPASSTVYGDGQQQYKMQQYPAEAAGDSGTSELYSGMPPGRVPDHYELPSGR
ncbi:hypothetical protein B0H63DRAFT_474199 [Podospora didyma]|uniref:Uncharacterized protein n=1 Tax=Podospora didyma TaxID=330526 RepID=A0AAE0NR00_9PEZI|nr:hypothetical protein B0H63DRAFT_474199 [Podospora didyma]